MAERLVCQRCRRPPVVCCCRYVHPLPTRTRVLLLQHPKESRVGIGTARMAHLGLPNSLLRVGLDFSDDEVVRAVLGGPQPACVLFPRPGALDVAELPRDQPITLVVLDGTWSLARKLLRLNPALAALPHVAFTPSRPSAYRIRRQPSGICVSTIEALAEVLNVIEPENGPFDRLLDPFSAMVAAQERFISEVGSHRHQRKRRAPRVSRRPPLATRLAADWSRLVCVQGDTNAWPRRDPAREAPEIVQWVAHRPATGETYEAVVTPRRPLAPRTPEQTELPAGRLFAGQDVETWRRSWRDFSRPDDVIVTWGRFYTDLAVDDGLEIPSPRLDLRNETLRLLQTRQTRPPRARGAQGLAPHDTALHGQPGASEAPPREPGQARARLRTVDMCAAFLGVAPSPLGLDGRAGRRLAALVGVLGALAEDDLAG